MTWPYEPSRGTVLPLPPTMPLPPPPPPKRHGVLIGAIVLLFVLIAGGMAVIAANVLTIGLTTGSTTRTNPTTSATIPGPAVGAIDAAPTGPINVDSIAAAVDPAVVDINIEVGYQNARAAGTGMLLTASGVVLTNNHVINGATDISVTDVGNGRTYNATVLGYDRSDDVALIQLDGASGLRTVSIGDSSTVSVDQPIVALGNAGGTGGTPTAVTGTVTALDQSITATDETGSNPSHLTGLIQIAADIQPGDSGGPLVDNAGRVIGMNTAASAGFRYSESGGEGYAIPINHALAIAQQIAAGNASTSVHIGSTAFLGVQTTSLRQSPGAAVLSVVPDSPADRAGLSRGDVIETVDGEDVDAPETLGALIGSHHPGDTITLGWTDGFGEPHSAQVALAQGPPA
jgi:S1-C subfamily serine protease